MLAELSRAVTALDERDEALALEHLLSAWRVSRAPEVERVVRAFSDGLCPPDKAHSHPHPLRVLDSWSRAPRLTQVTLAHELRRVGRQVEPPWDLKYLLERASALPEDPRMREVLLDAATTLNAQRYPAVCLAVCLEIKRLADSLLTEELARWCESLPAEDARRPYWERVLKLPQAAVTLPTAAESQLLEVLSTRAGSVGRDVPMPESAGRLLERVYENPDDLAARLVLADALLDSRDPLGELIQLQCQPEPSPEAGDRALSLLARHQVRWLSTLTPTPRPEQVKFERGFPHRVLLDDNPPLNLDVAPNAGWQTVREVDLSFYGSTRLAAVEWLAHPNLRHVRTLRTNTEGAAALADAKAPLSIRRLVLVLARPAESGLFDFPALPHLERLELSDPDAESVRTFATSAVRDRLTAFLATRAGSWRLRLQRATPQEPWSGELELESPSDRALQSVLVVLDALANHLPCALRVLCKRKLAKEQREALIASAGRVGQWVLELSPEP